MSGLSPRVQFSYNVALFVTKFAVKVRNIWIWETKFQIVLSMATVTDLLIPIEKMGESKVKFFENMTDILAKKDSQRALEELVDALIHQYKLISDLLNVAKSDHSDPISDYDKLASELLEVITFLTRVYYMEISSASHWHPLPSMRGCFF